MRMMARLLTTVDASSEQAKLKASSCCRCQDGARDDEKLRSRIPSLDSDTPLSETLYHSILTPTFVAVPQIAADPHT